MEQNKKYSDRLDDMDLYENVHIPIQMEQVRDKVFKKNKKPNILPFLYIARYAAAFVGGILLTVFYFNTKSIDIKGNKSVAVQEQNQVVIKEPSISDDQEDNKKITTIEENIIAKSKDAIPQKPSNQSNINQKNAINRIQTIVQKQLPIEQNVATSHPIITNNIIPNTVKPSTETQNQSIAQNSVKPPRTKRVHILDIEKDRTEIATYDNALDKFITQRNIISNQSTITLSDLFKKQ